MFKWLKRRQRKEQLRLIAELRQMGGVLRRFAETKALALQDAVADDGAAVISAMEADFEHLEALLDREEVLPAEVAAQLLRIHWEMKAEVDSIEAGRKAFRDRFGG